MTEFGKVVLFKEVNICVEDGINRISEIVATLKGDDLKCLSDKLRNLRHYVHEFEYWVDEQVRAQIEAEAERKVKAMIEAGFAFNSVTVDKVRFFINSAGKIQKNAPCQEDESIPF
jgi:hypothetical protein